MNSGVIFYGNRHCRRRLLLSAFAEDRPQGVVLEGHHRETYKGGLADGTRVGGVAGAEVCRVRNENWQ